MEMNHKLFWILSINSEFVSVFPNIISLIRPTFFLFFYVHSKDVAKHLAKSDDVAKFMDTATTKPPSEFRMISWNIDVLDSRNLKMRTKSVLNILQTHNPNIMFLQVNFCTRQ